MYIDSHCHLDFPELAAELPALLEAMRGNAVTHALCISVELAAWPAVVTIAHAHDNVYATVGVHPDYQDTEDPSVDELVARWKASAPDGWEDGDWRTADVYPPESCPAPGGS